MLVSSMVRHSLGEHQMLYRREATRQSLCRHAGTVPELAAQQRRSSLYSHYSLHIHKSKGPISQIAGMKNGPAPASKAGLAHMDVCVSSISAMLHAQSEIGMMVQLKVPLLTCTGKCMQAVAPDILAHLYVSGPTWQQAEVEADKGCVRQNIVPGRAGPDVSHCCGRSYLQG